MLKLIVTFFKENKDEENFNKLFKFLEKIVD